jgi:hypothetical protein
MLTHSDLPKLVAVLWSMLAGLGLVLRSLFRLARAPSGVVLFFVFR